MPRQLLLALGFVVVCGRAADVAASRGLHGEPLTPRPSTAPPAPACPSSLQLLAPSAGSPPPPLALAVSIDPTNVTDHVSDHMYGSGIETYEHQMCA